jgi:hypothetical protein
MIDFVISVRKNTHKTSGKKYTAEEKRKPTCNKGLD